MYSNVLIILLSILLSSVAHLFLKKGMMVHSLGTDVSGGILGLLWAISTNLWVMGGMFLHVSALAVWLWALSKVDITFAYPFLTLGYVLVYAMAWFWLGEELSSTKVLGMVVIITGIIILTKGG